MQAQDCEMEDDTTEEPICYLCQMAHGDNETVTRVHDYVKDSISSVHLEEIVRH